MNKKQWAIYLFVMLFFGVAALFLRDKYLREARG